MSEGGSGAVNNKCEIVTESQPMSDSGPARDAGNRSELQHLAQHHGYLGAQMRNWPLQWSVPSIYNMPL
jgi:hypothetical protein